MARKVQSPVPALTGPQLLLKGRFAIYETPSGGIHLVMQREGDTEEKHMELSPAILKMMRLAMPGAGDPAEMLRSMSQ